MLRLALVCALVAVGLSAPAVPKSWTGHLSNLLVDSTAYNSADGVTTTNCQCNGCGGPDHPSTTASERTNRHYTEADPAVWGHTSQAYSNDPAKGCAAACYRNETDNKPAHSESYPNARSSTDHKGCKVSLYDSTSSRCFLYDHGMTAITNQGESKYTCWASQHECHTSHNCEHHNPTPDPTASPTPSPTPSPTLNPTPVPSPSPTEHPTTRPPSPSPSHTPTETPTPAPSHTPTLSPTSAIAQLSTSGWSATQSDTTHSGVPARAIDGNDNMSWGSASCTHTSNTAGSWWNVELGSTKYISTVKVWNRSDCCNTRLTGSYVQVGGQTCTGTLSDDTSSSGQTITCNKSGSSVKIVSGGAGDLTLCEVQLFGY